MAAEVLSIAQTLFDTICEAKERWGQRKQNVALSEELQRFVQDLQTNMQELKKKAADTCSNSSTCALAALGEDLERADEVAKNILQKGFIKSIWDAKKTLSKIEALRQQVMTSFQTRILFITLDVAIDGQKGMDDFKTAMLKVNDNLREMYSTSNSSMKEVLRSELKLALRPMMEAMGLKEERIQAATLMIRSTEAQTSDAEKFFADVLAELEMIQKRETDSSNEASISMEGPNYERLIEWFEDPITNELMCDPVKAVDGHTYDRWTIVRYSGDSMSPFSPGQAFAIATDDIDVRSRLFARFPEQEVKFRTERASYRDEALEEANNEHLGDAVRMLGHVLEWAPDDKECRERRDQALLQMEVGESILKAGQVLEAGAQLRKGNYKLVMQKDDNLVIYFDEDENGVVMSTYATWSTKTQLKAGGKGECRLRMQSDGNLVVGADQREEVLWESNTATSSSNGEYTLHLKETGILEIRSSSGARHWCSEPMSNLMAGETLKAGSLLVKGAYKLEMQQDDNLVLYHLGNAHQLRALWASRTMGVAGGRVCAALSCNATVTLSFMMERAMLYG